MFTMIVAMQLATSVFFAIIWGVIALLIRLRAKKKQNQPAGIWSRFVCLGFDFAVIYILFSLFAYRGSLNNAVSLTVLIFFGYFFFFWLFFSSTPGKMIAGMKIVQKEGEKPLHTGQVALRLLGYVLLIISWLFALGKQKRTLHDRFSGTRVIYSYEKISERDKKDKILLLISLGVFVVLFVSYFMHGLGEVTNRYKESDNLKLVDINGDSAPDVLMFDLDKNGKYEMIKYDVNYDRIIDRVLYDLDDDERTDAVDINNDGRIDGYDFNSDSKIDEKVFNGYKYIYLWKIWSVLLGLGLVVVLVVAGIFERRSNKTIINKIIK